MTLSLVLVGNSVLAQEISVTEAQSNVLDFISNMPSSAKRAKSKNVSRDLSLSYTLTKEEKTCLYVFNIGDDNGFVIAGGDAAAREILGYCDHGSFDWNTAPENFKWWLSQYADQIALAEASVATPRRAKATTTRTTIKSLVGAKWNQGDPYNLLCPTDSHNLDSDNKPERFVTGCVATAMAQIMKKWKWPTSGNGSHGYSFTYTYGYENNKELTDKVTISAVDFGSTTYDWTNMPEIYSSSWTSKQQTAVATLMYHAGVSVDMQYNREAMGGSGANSRSIGSALVNYFKYSKSVRNEFRDYFSDEEWENLIYDELSAGRPIFYSGAHYYTEDNVQKRSGHQFICDGYESAYDMFSFNWGWGGYCDGYYPVSGTNNGVLQPNGSGIGGAGTDASYNNEQMIIINVMPDQDGTSVASACIVHYNENESIVVNDESNNSVSSYSRPDTDDSKTYTLIAKLYNRSALSSTQNIDLGVRATEQTTGKTYYWTSNSNENFPVNNIVTYDLEFNPFKIDFNGTYDLRPVCRTNGLTSDEDWVDVELYPNETLPTITVTNASEPEHIDITFSVESNEVQVGKTMQIEHNKTYNGSVTYTSNNTDIATVDENGIISGIAIGTVTITVTGEANGFFNQTTTNLTIDVTNLVKDNVEFTISDTSVRKGNTLSISWSDAYKGNVTFSSSNEDIATVNENGVISARSQGSVQIKASAEGNTYFNNNSTTFEVVVIGDDEDIVLTIEPYFNNDNNPYEGDFKFYYKIKNVSSNEIEIIYFLCDIYELDESDNSNNPAYKGKYYTNVAAGQEITDCIDFSEFCSKFKSGTKYKLIIYKDHNNGNWSGSYNYEYIIFTYRAPITVDYGVSPAGYGTLILPFNASCPNGMSVYSCNAVKDGYLVLTRENSIEQNNPYIVTGTYDDNDPLPYSFTGPNAVEESNKTFQKGVLIGAVTEDVELTSGSDYILQYDEEKDQASFYKYVQGEGEEIRKAAQYRAFMRIPSSIRNLCFSFPNMSDEEPEGIEVLKTEMIRPAGIYSIDGNRLSDFKKGLNLIILEDGTSQKVFVK